MINPRLQKFYLQVVCEDFLMLYNFTNVSALPKLERAILTSTSNRFTTSKACVVQSFCANYLQTGQKCSITRAHKSVDLFNIRKSNLLGLKLTLRNKKLFSFLDKLSIFVLPKLFSKNDNSKKMSLDGKNNVSHIEHGNMQNMGKEADLLLSSTLLPISEKKIGAPFENKASLLKLRETLLSQIGRDQSKWYSKNQKSRARKILQSKVGIGNQNQIMHAQDCFTVSNQSSFSFFEVSQLSIFFDSLSGFALSFYFEPLKDRICPSREKDGLRLLSQNESQVKNSSGIHNNFFEKTAVDLHQDQMKTDYLRMKRYSLIRGLMYNLQESNSSTNIGAREHKIKKHLFSAFGFPWFAK